MPPRKQRGSKSKGSEVEAAASEAQGDAMDTEAAVAEGATPEPPAQKSDQRGKKGRGGGASAGGGGRRRSSRTKGGAGAEATDAGTTDQGKSQEASDASRHVRGSACLVPTPFRRLLMSRFPHRPSSCGPPSRRAREPTCFTIRTTRWVTRYATVSCNETASPSVDTRCHTLWNRR